MSSLGTIRSYPNNTRAAKALITAAYSGVKFDFEDFNFDTDKTPEFLKRFPMGKVPVLEGNEVDLFESTAISYYAAFKGESSALLGQSAEEKALILQWSLFADNEIAANVGQWIYPLMGYYPYLKPSVDLAIERTKRALEALNKVLLTRTYLVGESITFADIAVVTSLALPFSEVFDKEFRSHYKNVVRYFTTVAAKPHFKAALGEVKLCTTPLKYNPPKKEKKEAKKEVKKEINKEAKKEKPKKDADTEADDEPKPAPKPKSALDLLPPSKFKMDDWKRMYSNNDTDVAMKWFWENFDPEGYSLWRVDYKYNDELTVIFMSCNLIGGFYARLERAHKYAFGSMVVRGTNNNNSISGIFIIRGQSIPEEVSDAADFDSYNFVKIEPSQYEEKKEEIYKFMAWDFDDLADGKVFK